MVRIHLVPHDVKYAEEMSILTSVPEVRTALGMTDEQCSVAGTRNFIRLMQLEERLGQQLSRMIFDEKNQLIGVISLKGIDEEQKLCHIGTWLARPYWGKGYNQMAKMEMFKIAFERLHLNYVFAGARLENIRSQKAQAKLPYMTLHVERQFYSEWKKLEQQERTPCVLNVVRKVDFLNWYYQNAAVS
ncbi:GNAT family N-acetyltransferase [Rummeliibacillus pycnus]|uniref:GNAT family N-acetyltransferase n=1 Tax=Rummeliibacillus pycnus TaxID=101070 RepID=UPI003D293D60